MKCSYRLLILILLLGYSIQSSYGQNQDINSPERGEKIFSFGLIADIQYADIDKGGKRDYRTSVDKLEIAVNELNRHDLSFSINLGDIIDRNFESYDKPQAMLAKLNSQLYSVIGNHDFTVEERYISQIREIQGNKKGYFDFTVGDFTFIVVDGSKVSLFANVEGSKGYKAAEKEMKELKASGAKNAKKWNGGVGSKQFKWIEKRLERAKKDNKRVVIFSHWPLLPENGTQLWHNREMISLIDSYSNVVAWIAGHHHVGGYHKPKSIHHLIMKGMVQAETETSFGIIDVYNDRLVLKGYGDQDSRVMVIE